MHPTPVLRSSAALLPALALAVLAHAPLTAQSSPDSPDAPSAAAAAGFDVDDILDVANVTIADVSRDGRWLAAISGTLRDRIGIDNHRFGDPTYTAPRLADVWVIDTRTGERRSVFPDKRQVRALRWSPDASRLALMAMRGDVFEAVVWERASGRTRPVRVPRDRELDELGELLWTPDGTNILLPLRAAGWRADARARFEREVGGPIVVQSSREPFLSWESIRRLPLRRSLVAYDVAAGTVRELVPESLIRSYELAEDGTFVTWHEDITEKTDYERIFGSDNRIKVTPIAGGETRTLIASTRGINPIWSADGRSFAYHRNGEVFFGSVDTAEPRKLIARDTAPRSGRDAAAAARPAPGREPGAAAERDASRFSAVRLSPRGTYLVASNSEGLWIVETTSGERDQFLDADPEDREAPRRQVLDWSPDEEAVYLSHASRTAWERGVLRFHRPTGRLDTLMIGRDRQTGLRLSQDGGTWVFASTPGNRPAELYAADADFTNVRKLTDANPRLAERALAETELVSYLDVDGRRLYGVLYYPIGYEAGRRYPTVFIVYEQYFDDNFNGVVNLLAANGYAVMLPSVELERGYPGEAWLKGVTAAANKLIEMGVADGERLGVHGTSYGGYATNLLITQTNRFKAAINISGKVNMVSFYTDSPRLGVRNIHAPERSQDRIGATLWEQPQKYIAHSAVMYADRIRTPLLLMTGEQDHNVPGRQAMEMYYALRRLGREVEWVNYVNGGHGLPTSSIAEVRDYHERILGWYGRWLKEEGVMADR